MSLHLRNFTSEEKSVLSCQKWTKFRQKMPPPSKPSRRFSFFGLVAGGNNPNKDDLEPPQLKLEVDREVYRPSDLVTIMVEIKTQHPKGHFRSLLIEKHNFEIKEVEKLDLLCPSSNASTWRPMYAIYDCQLIRHPRGIHV
ncbi:Uncharacterized protein Fot_12998 [Forsythia ovata]|uniref:Uncharacterized protein n=1 Tax=Forsythia ovata TaxID=205694 RepID=A0ABD1W273_9LAMI